MIEISIEKMRNEMAPKTVSAQYIYIDIVGFSTNRNVEAQTDIIGRLNNSVTQSLHENGITRRRYIPLPTGDGMCIALLSVHEPYDIAILVGMNILHLVNEGNNTEKDEMRKFKIRVGINENIDNPIKDITGRKNLAGAGINLAQRIMDQGDDSHLLVGRSLYDRLSQREKYQSKFRRYVAIVKHGQQIEVYQYIETDKHYLNNEIPIVFRKPAVGNKNLPLIVGIYLILGVKYQDDITTLFSEAYDVYVLQLTLFYLAKDFANLYQRNTFDDEPHLFFSKQIRDNAVDFKSAFHYLKENHA